MSDFHKLQMLAQLEQTLLQYYGLVSCHSVVNYLVTREDLQTLLGKRIQSHPEWKAKAAVWMDQGEDELFIGVHFDSVVTDHLNTDLSRPTTAQLDAYCTAVEEISHFHLILQRLEDSLNVSKLELELQAEIDKLLFTSQALSQSSGRDQIEALSQLLYDFATVTNGNAKLYWEATRYAARFWAQAIKRGWRTDADLQSFLRLFYRASLGEKLSQIERLELRRA